MIAVDTNVLVYAHRRDSPHHPAALAALRSLVERGRRWGVPWPCVHEFLSVVTHPRVYRPPSGATDALAAVNDLAALPGATLLTESSTHLALLSDLCAQPGVVGPRVHDARIAAICLGHDVDELWTADRDFSLFPALQTRNPLAVP